MPPSDWGKIWKERKEILTKDVAAQAVIGPKIRKMIKLRQVIVVSWITIV